MLGPNRQVDLIVSGYFYDGDPISRGNMIFYHKKDQLCVTNKPSSRLAGIILNDVVDFDMKKQHLNFYKDQVQLGDMVSICRRGRLMIKAIKGSKAGNTLYWSGRNYTNKEYNYLGLKHIPIGKILNTDKYWSNIYLEI